MTSRRLPAGGAASCSRSKSTMPPVLAPHSRSSPSIHSRRLHMSGVTRRAVLIGGAAGTAALVAGRAWGQQKELIANTYGGGWEQGHRQAIAEPIEKKT